MKRFIILLLLVSFISKAGFAYEETKVLTMSAIDIEMIDINCGAGFLIVKGEESLHTITVTAEIVIKNNKDHDGEEIIEKYLKLDFEKKGNTAVLNSHFERSSFSLIRRNNIQVQVNLTAVTPKYIDLKIKDGSGNIQIETIDGDIYITDGSGNMGIKYINGAVEIEDGSGVIDVENVTGTIDIEDGSGNIDIETIAGDISIDDNSGSIDIKDIDGNVVIRDGSGSITIDGVEKDVTIEEDGSGSVRIKNVKGRVVRKDD